MKLFAPRNEGVNWDVRRGDSGWSMLGGTQTVSGKRVSEDSALTSAPVMAATRLISEAVASLPLNTLRRKDYRTTEKASNHPLWSILHDVPNPEQDKMCWFDMQVAFQCNWGNAYAEVQRIGKDIVALWPIHPSRIPTCNIRRNPFGVDSWRHIVVGQPGEIIYWVRNDDGTVTPIPASDMLHVPGILSTNGITGQSIVKYAANAIGIGQATEEHAGAFFKNGASYSLAIVSDKAVNKETAARLRASWQATYEGGANSYKTLILEDGMKPMPLSSEPEKSQLTLSRQFSVSEVARFWKVPPHMIGDLTRSTNNNIEQQYLEFVIHSLGPWVERWEKALFRQLLSDEEKKTYLFKFNLNGMLRGDSAARSAFYQSLFNMGVVSPNDIRELEDWNPVEGGDERFIPANNLFPLTKAGEMADAQIKKLKEPPPAPQQPAREPAQKPTDEVLREVKLTQELVKLYADGRVTIEDLRRIESSGVQNTQAVIEEFGNLSTTIAQSEQRIEKAVQTAIAPLATLEQVQNIASDTQKTTTHQIAASEVRVIAAAEKSDAALAERIETSANTERDAVVEMVVRQSETNREHTTKTVAAVAEKLEKQAESRDNALKTEVLSQIQTPQDTSAIEAVAVREAALESERATLDARLVAERETIERVLTLALKRTIDGLAIWEAKALTKAVDKPLEWQNWRTGFYQRFRRHFESEITEFCAGFEACGVILDLPWGADRYAGRSISDLKTLDQVAADNWSDRLKETVDHFLKRDWTGRSSALAGEMVERGKKLFEERKEQKCQS